MGEGVEKGGRHIPFNKKTGTITYTRGSDGVINRYREEGKKTQGGRKKISFLGIKT